MKIKICIVALAVLSIMGCSSSNDNTTDNDSSAANDGSTGSDAMGGDGSTGNDDPTVAGTGNQQGTILTPDFSVVPSADEYPSNEELAAADGVPEIEQARALAVGTWEAIDAATQCVTTFRLGGNGNFDLSSSNQRASGRYNLYMEGSRIEIDESYSSENFLTNCKGDIADSDSLDLGVGYSANLEFPDQNTMEYKSGSFVIHSFARQ